MPKKILFICIGNSCRSPMAEAIARQDSAGVIEASSAGLAPLGFVAEMTKQTLTRNGYAVDGLSSKPILREAWEAADKVINMSGYQKERAFPGFSKVEDWEVDDPYGEHPDVYQSVFASIRRHVAELSKRLNKDGL